MVYIPQDKWMERAKREGYLARSAYKLLDIDRRFKIFQKGDLVLDLGASPGSWTQVAFKKIGARGFIIAVDIEPVQVRKSDNFLFLKKDIYDSDLVSDLREVSKKKFSVILSDVGPKTTGQKDIDQWRAHELALKVLDIIKSELKEKGNAVVKIYEGPDTPEIIKISKSLFARVNLIKPEASTKGSKEAYIICKGFKSARI